MKRSEKIYEYIREYSLGRKKEELQGAIGLEAQEIADALGILRNNVSKELNELHRLDRIVKFKGRRPASTWMYPNAAARRRRRKKPIPSPV